MTNDFHCQFNYHEISITKFGFDSTKQNKSLPNTQQPLLFSFFVKHDRLEKHGSQYLSR
jgi:hypothetical protein